MNKNILAGAGIALAIVLSLFGLVRNNQSVQLPSEPVQRGVTNYDTISGTTLQIGSNCNNGMATCTGASITGLGQVISAGVLATTTSVTGTFVPTDLAYSTISLVPIVGSITMTLPATTTSGMSTFLPNSGDRTSIALINSTTTQGINLTLAGNTGMILTNASTSLVLPASMKNGVFSNGLAHLIFIRKPNTDIEVQLIPSI